MFLFLTWVHLMKGPVGDLLRACEVKEVAVVVVLVSLQCFPLYHPSIYLTSDLRDGHGSVLIYRGVEQTICLSSTHTNINKSKATFITVRISLTPHVWAIILSW